MRISLLLLVVFVFLSCNLSACGIFARNYRYSEKKYTMSPNQINYHEKVMDDFKKRTESANRSGKSKVYILKMQCKLLRNAVQSAPTSLFYVSAKELLEADRDDICSKVESASNGLGGNCPDGTSVVRTPFQEYCASEYHTQNSWNVTKNGWYMEFYDVRYPNNDSSAENLTKSVEGQYKNDKKDGEWICYYKNCRKKSQGFFKDDKKIGKWQYWDADGEEILSDTLLEEIETLYSNKDYQAAQAKAKNCLELFPDNEECSELLADIELDYAGEMHSKALANLKQERYEEALTIAKQCSESFPDYENCKKLMPSINAGYAKSFEAKAKAAKKRKETYEAYTLANQCLEIDAGNMTCYKIKNYSHDTLAKTAPHHIKTTYAEREGEGWQTYFTLVNANGELIAADGSIEYQIIVTNYKESYTLYNGPMAVFNAKHIKKEDFQKRIVGVGFYKTQSLLYMWYLPERALQGVQRYQGQLREYLRGYEYKVWLQFVFTDFAGKVHKGKVELRAE